MKLIIFLLFWVGISTTVMAQENRPFILVLDAGHGGDDGGAHGVKDNESHITLDITLKVGKLIEKYYGKNVEVIYTRKTDVFIELNKRADIANKNHADLFISIHCNSARASAYGTETFVLGTEDHRASANQSVVQRENSVILLEEDFEETYQEYNPNSPESIIGLTLMQNVHLENSLKFASYVEDNFVNKDGRRSRGVKQAGFLVLWRTAMPSVLIETGFISNPDEGRYLASENGKNKTAQSIFNAFKKYKNEWDIKQGKKLVEIPKGDSNNTTKEPQPKPAPPVQEISAEATTYYTVQIMNSKRFYEKGHRIFRKLDNIDRVKQGESYKYYYQKAQNAEDLQNALKKARSAGFKDAFVAEIKKEAPQEVKINTQAPKNGTGYRVQILTSQRNYAANAPQMKGLRPVDKIKENSLYKYYYGWFKTPQDANKAIPTIRAQGFSDAFVVEFKNGKKL